MKKQKIIIATIILSCLLSPLFALAGKGNGGSTAVLTESEAANVIHLREEEKLARDVYLALYAFWKETIFLSISASEQQHMDSVKGLIDKYGLEDPVVDESSCAFTRGDFAVLCDSLIAQGKDSLEKALKVGVIIEEMDIEDIEIMLETATPTDVRSVMANLMAGSYNHLEAFEGALELQ